MMVHIKRSILALLGCLLFTMSSQAAVYDLNETAAEKADRLEWYRHAKFGMFIHWGVYSTLGGEYKGEGFKLSLKEHIMCQMKIPRDEYRAVAAGWNPHGFDADEWMRKAREAGMRYFVITSKHHDGFALFDSDVSDHNMVDATPFKRDVIGELSRAAEKQDITFGVYYSQAWDWWHPGGQKNEGFWDEGQKGSGEAYIRTIAEPQVRELLTRYPNIDLMWWDTGHKMAWTDGRAVLGETIKELKSDLVINSRLLSDDYPGDFETIEGAFPAFPPAGHEDWEVCMTMNNSWGWVKPHIPGFEFIEPAWLLKRMTTAWGMGGNVLLNIGPKPDGTFGEKNDERLAYVGTWMEKNGRAVYGSEPNPFRVSPWGTATVTHGDDGHAIINLLVYYWPEDGALEIPGIRSSVTAANLLASGAAVPFAMESKTLKLTVPKTAPHDAVSIIQLHLAGSSVDVASGLPELGTDGVPVSLGATSARINHLSAKNMAVVGRGEEAHIAKWDYTTWLPSSVQWEVAVRKRGTYRVIAEVASEQSNAVYLAGHFVGNKYRPGKHPGEIASIPATGGFEKWQEVDIGTVTYAEAGEYRLTLAPARANTFHQLHLKRLILQETN